MLLENSLFRLIRRCHAKSILQFREMTGGLLEAHKYDYHVAGRVHGVKKSNRT